ncbi:probable methyltransferase PMT20 [Tanacetum coccineum]
MGLNLIPLSLSSIPKWPERLHEAPDRIGDVKVVMLKVAVPGDFKRDDSTWKKRVSLFISESHKCEMKHVLLEMDRILRPQGYALIRESSYFVDAVATIAKGLRWDCPVKTN